jgi:hypothetical protein
MFWLDLMTTVTRQRRRRKPPRPVKNLKVKARVVKHRRRIVTTGVLTWTFPTQRTDGTNIGADALTATVFDSFTPGPGIGTATGSAGSSGTFTTNALDPGTHNFTVIITDSEGNASAASDVAALVVTSQLAPPDAVDDLAVTAGA